MRMHAWWAAVAIVACGDEATTFPNGSSSGAGGAGSCELEGQQCPILCDADLGCVDCLTNDDCGAADPVCVAGECEECGAPDDCPTGQSCFPKEHTCEPACDGNQDCNEGDEPLCDPALAACVGCIDAADCAADEPICSAVTKQCVECQANDDCGAAEPICDPADGKCRQCLLDAHCPASEPHCVEHECTTDSTPDTCDGGTTLCGDECVDPQVDPDHCNACDSPCESDQYCSAGSCSCKPGLDFVAGQGCVDLESDPNNCGDPGMQCTGGDAQCQDGDCVDGCEGGLQNCDNACVDLDDNPLHCGECSKACDQDEVCADGECRDWKPALGGACSSCSGDFSTCCDYPDLDGFAICVDGPCP